MSETWEVREMTRVGNIISILEAHEDVKIGIMIDDWRARLPDQSEASDHSQPIRGQDIGSRAFHFKGLC